MIILREFQNNIEKGGAYFTIGNDYIIAARDLFRDRHASNTNDLSFALLLVTGLELVFKSFLLFHNNTIEEKDLMNMSHDYKKAYNECKKKNNVTLNSTEIEEIVNELSDVFPNSKECRYPKGNFQFSFTDNTFEIIIDKLLRPIGILYKKDFSFTL